MTNYAKRPRVLSRGAVTAVTMAMCSIAACTANHDEPTADRHVAVDEQPIIGGVPNDTYWCVAELLIHDPGVSSGTICSCTVIGLGDTCLTAAHCVDPRVIGAGKQFQVRLSTDPSIPLQLSTGTSTTFDPQWDPNNMAGGHDFGLVRMSPSWTGIASVCGRGNVDLSSFVTLVGFGANTHSDTGVGVRRAIGTSIVSADSLLLHAGNSNAQACHGDSGGPAIQQQNGERNVVGVTSFGTDQLPQVCFNGSFSARVDSATNWINQNVPCGNGVCEPQFGETITSCPHDCHVCGDGFCAWGPENITNCAVDCDICGNGSCDGDENSSSCPADCGFQCEGDDPSILCFQAPA